MERWAHSTIRRTLEPLRLRAAARPVARPPARAPARGRRAIATLKVGVISDTHGLLRPEVRVFLSGCDYIVHGGDVGDAGILEQLSAMAPLIAVRGNNDREPWARRLKTTELVRLGEVFAYVIHDLADLDIDPEARRVKLVISGHSHQPRIEWRGEVLYLNPGSCGPRRFKLPVSAAELIIAGSRVQARTVGLL